jgi:hypothetical protein
MGSSGMRNEKPAWKLRPSLPYERFGNQGGKVDGNVKKWSVWHKVMV